MKCIVLGCAGSFGTPYLLCECSICTSRDLKNIRTRASIYVQSTSGSSVVVDTSSDFRQQALNNSIKKIDALIYTHEHADHISGIDDVKPFIFAKSEGLMPVYITEHTFNCINKTYGYLFETKSKYYRPLMREHIIHDYDVINIGSDLKIQTIDQMHGEIQSLGLIFNGKLAYSTDFHKLPQKSLDMLKGIDTWIIDCLRFHWAPTHCFWETTLYYIDQVAPKRAILTHLGHEIDYEKMKSIMPSGVEIAYDSMVIDL